MAIPKILDHERKLKNIQDGEGELSIKESQSTEASGESSHAEGGNTTASGYASHAEGSETTASGGASHAEGLSTTASSMASHAEGFDTTASGMASHAEGFSTTASGGASHAQGLGTTASGDNSHAEGYGTTASSKSQHAQGEYNIIEEVEDGTVRGTYAHIVGNGTNYNARSNAHTLDWSGNAWYSGDVYVGSTSGTNRDEGSKKLATEEYVDNNGGVFWAEYGVTTSEELQTAYLQGKNINVLYNDCIYILDHISNVSNGIPTYFCFSNSWANNGHGGYIQSITYSGSNWSAWNKQYLPKSSYNSSDSSNNYFTNSNFMNGASDLAVGQARNITASTQEPTASDGKVGDIWIVYTE